MFPAFLIQIVLMLLVVGVLLWGLNAIPAIDPTIKQFIKVAIIVVVAIWLIYVLAAVLGGGVGGGGGPVAWPFRR
jgi:hypothetical protein